MSDFNYDKTKDKKLSEVFVPTSETSGIIVAIYSYDGAEPKIRFSGWYVNKEGDKQFCKANLKVKFIEKITAGMTQVYNEFKNKSLQTPDEPFENDKPNEPMSF